MRNSQIAKLVLVASLGAIALASGASIAVTSEAEQPSGEWIVDTISSGGQVVHGIAIDSETGEEMLADMKPVDPSTGTASVLFPAGTGEYRVDLYDQGGTRVAIGPKGVLEHD